MTEQTYVAGDHMSSNLGLKIKSLRREKGMTLDQIALATGSSKSYMWEIEHKPVVRPSAEKLARIAEVLGVTTEYLMNQDRNQPAESDLDVAFFRKFQSADPTVKDKLKRILDVLDTDGE